MSAVCIGGHMGYLYETHLHTSEVSACAVSSAAQQAVNYKRKGYAGIIVTDHFINGYSTCPKKLPWENKMRYFASGYEAAKKKGDEIGLDVFFGWEFTIKGADFLTYGLDLDFLISHPRLDLMSIEEYSALVRKSGGYLAQAHPYRDAYYIEHNYPVRPELLDGVEVYNSYDREASNSRAYAFAQDNNLPMQSGTDSHGKIDRRYRGIILENKAETIHDIINAIKANEVKLI